MSAGCWKIFVKVSNLMLYVYLWCHRRYIYRTWSNKTLLFNYISSIDWRESTLQLINYLLVRILCISWLFIENASKRISFVMWCKWLNRDIYPLIICICWNILYLQFVRNLFSLIWTFLYYSNSQIYVYTLHDNL